MEPMVAPGSSPRSPGRRAAAAKALMAHPVSPRMTGEGSDMDVDVAQIQALMGAHTLVQMPAVSEADHQGVDQQGAAAAKARPGSAESALMSYLSSVVTNSQPRSGTDQEAVAPGVQQLYAQQRLRDGEVLVVASSPGLLSCNNKAAGCGGRSTTTSTTTTTAAAVASAAIQPPVALLKVLQDRAERLRSLVSSSAGDAPTPQPGSTSNQQHASPRAVDMAAVAMGQVHQLHSAQQQAGKQRQQELLTEQQVEAMAQPMIAAATAARAAATVAAALAAAPAPAAEVPAVDLAAGLDLSGAVQVRRMWEVPASPPATPNNNDTSAHATIDNHVDGAQAAAPKSPATAPRVAGTGAGYATRSVDMCTPPANPRYRSSSPRGADDMSSWTSGTSPSYNDLYNQQQGQPQHQHIQSSLHHHQQQQERGRPRSSPLRMQSAYERHVSRVRTPPGPGLRTSVGPTATSAVLAEPFQGPDFTRIVSGSSK